MAGLLALITSLANCVLFMLARVLRCASLRFGREECSGDSGGLYAWSSWCDVEDSALLGR